MRNRWITLAGAGIGAGFMYFFDPDRGKRRRRMLNDQVSDAGQKLQSGINKTGRSYRNITNSVTSNLSNNHTMGALSSMRANLGFRSSDSKRLAKRVRANLSRIASNSASFPNSIKVTTQSGRALRYSWISLLVAGAGAGLMYFFDPQQGRSRWSRLKAQFVHLGHSFQSGTSKTGRDISNRARGVSASMRSLFSSSSRRAGVDAGNNDEVLAQRVRSRLGRVVTHPASIHVRAQDGRVILSGPVLAQEAGQLIWQVYTVRGVKEVENHLEVHEQAGQIPGLQGEGTPRQGKSGIFRQTNWSPAVRVIVGAAGAYSIAAGAYALISGSRRPSLIRRPIRNKWVGAASTIGGSLLAARSITNIEFSRLTGIGARRSAINVQKTIHINAPVQRVFAQWADFENFPTFMTHVRQVRRLEDARQGRHWRWTVDGPAGTRIEFDTTITAYKNERLIAWGTDSSSMIKHVGRVEFIDDGDGATTVKVRMSYNPIAGALGHAVAKFFGADPKKQMDEDLMRFKSYIETGKLPHGAQQATGTQAGAASARSSRSTQTH